MEGREQSRYGCEPNKSDINAFLKENEGGPGPVAGPAGSPGQAARLSVWRRPRRHLHILFLSGKVSHSRPPRRRCPQAAFPENSEPRAAHDSRQQVAPLVGSRVRLGNKNECPTRPARPARPHRDEYAHARRPPGCADRGHRLPDRQWDALPRRFPWRRGPRQASRPSGCAGPAAWE